MKEEILDVVDENDNVIGTATREECHSDPSLIHRTSHFTLIDKGKKKVLLTQRSHKKKHDPGKYCFLGEHLVTGDSYKDAVIKGSQQELSYKVKNSTYMTKNFFRYDSQSEFVHFYIVDWDGSELSFDEDEIQQILWVDLESLQSSTYDLSAMTKLWVDRVDWDSMF